MRGETREGIDAQICLIAFCHPALGLSATRRPSKHHTNVPGWQTSRLLRPEFAIYRLDRITRPGVQSRGLPDTHSTPWRRRQSPAQWPPRPLAVVDDVPTLVRGHHARSGVEPLRC